MRAALFDLDDTILDRSGSLRDFVSWQASGMLRSSITNPSLFTERFIALDQNGTVWKDKVYDSLIEEFNITGWSVAELLDTYLLTFCAFCKPRNGVRTILEEFRRRGFRIGLVSNGKTPFQERNFQALGLSEYFDCVVVSEAVGMRKPEKAMFELACNMIDADIESSVFIGDNPVADIQGAKNAGMTTIYVPADAAYKPSDFADYTCDNMFQLVDLADF